MMLCAGCGEKKHEKPAPQVGFVVVKPTRVPIPTELVGRINAFESSEVRPQVSGILRARLFTEGSNVRAGQTLYQIDPSPYRASFDQAQANLASARANVEAAQTRAERYRPLAEMEAVSKQDYTDASAQARQAAAAVKQSEAQVETARINLNYTRVPAPISGRIGRSLFTQGALVTADQASPLAIIQRLDPVYVDIQQSSADMLALRRALAGGGMESSTATIRLKLEDGSDYGPTGTIQFAESIVDSTTGTVTLRARFPNPDGLLMPGMFARAVFVQAINTNAFLVPQQGVSRNPRGNASVLIVDKDNRVAQRTITATTTIGTNWVVTEGLEPGDRVITEGLGAIKPGDKVQPVPAGSPQNISPDRGKKASGAGTGNPGSKAS